MWFLYPQARKFINLRSRGEIAHGGTKRHYIYAIWRFLQFIAGLVVLGMYAAGTDFSKISSSSKELFGIILGSLSAVWSFAAMFELISPGNLLSAILDWVISLGYVVLVGIWGSMYLPKQEPGVMANTSDKDTRMHHAVYVDIAGMILSVLAATYTSGKRWSARKGNSMPGGET